GLVGPDAAEAQRTPGRRACPPPTSCAGETGHRTDGVQAVRGQRDPPSMPDRANRPAAGLSAAELQPVAVGALARRCVLADKNTMLKDRRLMSESGRSDSCGRRSLPDGLVAENA